MCQAEEGNDRRVRVHLDRSTYWLPWLELRIDPDVEALRGSSPRTPLRNAGSPRFAECVLA